MRVPTIFVAALGRFNCAPELIVIVEEAAKVLEELLPIESVPPLTVVVPV